MKMKLKSPDIAKVKGPDFVKKLLKKKLMEEIVEPQQFLYHASFEYDEHPEPAPVMFIGEVPSFWKKWVKTVKTSKEFVAGRCTFDPNTKELKLEIALGKGGKSMVLKRVQKALLKPFAKAVFVESLEGARATVEEIEEKEATEETMQQSGMEVKIEDYIKDIQSFLTEGESIRVKLHDFVSGLGEQLKDISKTIVTDALIKEADKANQELNTVDLSSFFKETTTWLKALPKEIVEDAKMQAEQKVYERMEKELKQLEPTVARLLGNCQLLKKVEDPTTSSNPPISDHPIINFGMALNKHQTIFK